MVTKLSNSVRGFTSPCASSGNTLVPAIHPPRIERRAHDRRPLLGGTLRIRRAEEHQHGRLDAVDVRDGRRLAHRLERLDARRVRVPVPADGLDEAPVRDVGDVDHARDIRHRVPQHRASEPPGVLPDEVRPEEPSVRPADDRDAIRVRDPGRDRVVRDRDAIGDVLRPRLAADEVSERRVAVPRAPAVVTIRHRVPERRKVRDARNERRGGSTSAGRRGGAR